MPSSGHTYFIINKKSGTAFDLSGADQRSIIGFNLHRGDNQKWTTVQHDDGWTFQNVYNKKWLDISASKPENGIQVIAVENPEHGPRKWCIKADGDGWRILIKDSNQTVDLSDHGNAVPGTPVTLWGEWKGLNQIWKFEEA